MENYVVADYLGSPDDEWGDGDPSVFEMHIIKTLKGEYQLTNGYGPDEAPKIMKVNCLTLLYLLIKLILKYIKQVNIAKLSNNRRIIGAPTLSKMISGSCHSMVSMLLEFQLAGGSNTTPLHRNRLLGVLCKL